mmetsp:Transcript_9112/g.10410  ORF Transcript_9112/g.10410 Transcript_9112/m.10410 type:complete len:132 (-) Transcript_9112:436-831(-)|eukprot:CAMPEP_0184021942 /NCGR_PEP_ID=MMETSP0954-20121128/10259_1 /TAXON_ID=627963 /ORGANISM="Aplanochytrium sp, Strain PBS07" /LENGTH=131 /DNA_ID=CAMNT_0026304119 /DNA_START=32 /DNA_END=427 /DNA_ORIENTATION=-
MDPSMQASAQQQLQQLQSQLGGQEITQENVAKLEQQKRQAEEMKVQMLTQICTPEALQRLQTVKLVKPTVYSTVEMEILNAAKNGRLGGKIGEEVVKGMLERAGLSTVTKVKFQRKRDPFDSDDDNDDDLM